MTRLKKGDRCQHEGCRKNATTLTAYDSYEKNGQLPKIEKYCDDHADLHIREPDYEMPTATCPNCGCRFGA